MSQSFCEDSVLVCVKHSVGLRDWLWLASPSSLEHCPSVDSGPGREKGTPLAGSEAVCSQGLGSSPKPALEPLQDRRRNQGPAGPGALWEILSIDPGAQCSPDALPVEGGACSQLGALDAPTEQCLMCP